MAVGSTVKSRGQASYCFESFIQAADHTRTEYDDEEKTAVPDWVVVMAGSC